MCENINKIEQSTAIGYKIVITSPNGLHYSPFTGIQYKVGPVPKYNRKYGAYKHKANDDIRWSDKQFDLRLTGVFETYNDAKNLDHAVVALCDVPKWFKRNMIRMQLSGNIHTGTVCGGSVEIMLGNHIDAMEVVRKYKKRNEHLKINIMTILLGSKLFANSDMSDLTLEYDTWLTHKSDSFEILSTSLTTNNKTHETAIIYYLLVTWKAKT
jgi:hypothetical protein